jgi:flagellar P-ring protein precursor FlgI
LSWFTQVEKPMRRHSLLAVALTVLALVPGAGASPVRLKELVEVQGVRDNELFGYGLVVGLNGTGDTDQVFFTSQSISGMLGRLGVRIDPKDIHARNVAAVMITARLPTFSRAGTRLDVTVSSMGNARSLQGGVLIVTPLTGADGAVYALAQGPVQVGGFQVAGAGSSQAKNTPTSGRIPGGATIERTVTPDLTQGPLVLELTQPDFTTASRIAAAVNTALGAGSARATDPAAVEVKLTDANKADAVGLVAKLEALEVEADQKARVVVSERTGTVVIGDRVRLRPVAVAHGGLSISVAQSTAVSQPGPLAQGKTAVTRQAELHATEQKQALVALPETTTVSDLVKALNLLGASPRDLIAILQALKAAGALDAEIEVL